MNPDDPDEPDVPKNPVAAHDRAWAAKERTFFMAFQDRQAIAGEDKPRVVRNVRLPQESDVKTFRSWALALAGLGAVAGFITKFADPKGGMLAMAAGFALFAFVAGIYAWVYARRLERTIALHKLAKEDSDAKRAALVAAHPPPPKQPKRHSKSGVRSKR